MNMKDTLLLKIANTIVANLNNVPSDGLFYGKTAVTGIICFSAPEIGIVYAFLDMTGNADRLIDYVIDQINCMYSR